MVDALRHRGPEDEGLWIDREDGVALGHRRLSIIDLTAAGHQPMNSAGGRYMIAFNGEIYNHLVLREKLESASPLSTQAWRGHSDTETLLAGFEVWGVEETLKQAVGMFALAIWDRRERRLHLARDRFGEKPLYYGWAGGGFVFGSELKALKCYPGFDHQVDRDVLSLFLKFCYVPAPYSIYRGTYKLEAGCVLSLSLDGASTAPAGALFAPARHGRLAINRFWSLADVAQRGLADPIRDEQEGVARLEAALREAVRLQSFADVPVGAFLSGGIDSSTVAALMQAQSGRPIRTFTIGFEDIQFNEAVYAKEVARHLGTEHT